MGDPNYRGLSKMELDPLITQRLRDNARTSLCQEHVQAFAKCSKDSVRADCDPSLYVARIRMSLSVRASACG